jgi:hypothetical protein
MELCNIMKKVLSVFIQTKSQQILLDFIRKELSDNGEGHCFVFALYGVLGLLYKKGAELVGISNLCKKFVKSEEYSQKDEYLMNDEQCSNLDIKIVPKKKWCFLNMDSSDFSKICTAQLESGKLYLIDINFSGFKKGHFTSLKVDIRHSVVYSLDQKSNIGAIESLSDPGLIIMNGNLSEALYGYFSSHGTKVVESFSIYEVKPLTVDSGTENMSDFKRRKYNSVYAV